MAKNIALETTEETKTITENIPKYSIEKLRENCLTLFAVSISTFDGATYKLTGHFTINEMQEIIKKWGEKEVK